VGDRRGEKQEREKRTEREERREGDGGGEKQEREKKTERGEEKQERGKKGRIRKGEIKTPHAGCFFLAGGGISRENCLFLRSIMPC
jgi:hypothetical protein